MKIISVIIGMLWKCFKGILKYLGVPLLFVFIILFLLFIFWLIKFARSGDMPKFKNKAPSVKGVSLLEKLFIQFPKMLAYDTLNRDPLEFAPFGINVVAGKQGSGKTITAIYMILQWKKRYPDMQVYDNYCLIDKYVDGRLDNAKDLMIHDNGIYGVVNLLDEIQNWFPSSASRILPVEVLAEICQQRKQRKVTLGTTQIFGKVAKQLREQTMKVYIPVTLLGCITFVRSFEADSYDMETNKFKRSGGDFFFFVHTKELREAYDTYQKMEIYKVSDFEPSVNGCFSDSEGTS